MSEFVKCPRCNAPTQPNARCWLCHAEVGVGIPVAEVADENPFASPAVAGDSAQYHLVLVILLVALIVVLAALAAVAPGLAIGLAVIAAPALIRTAVVTSRKTREGMPTSATETSILFMASVAGVVTAGAAATGTFLVTCTAACFGVLALSPRGLDDGALSVTIPAAVIVGLFVGGWVLYALWKRRL